MFKTIICAFDGSDHAQAALKLACDMTEKYAAALHVVSVPRTITDTLAIGYGAVSIPPTHEAIQEVVKDVKIRAQKIVDNNGAPSVTYHVEMGEPGSVIVDYARDVGGDLIVMGRRGVGNLGGLLVGSTTNRVSQLADCAVLTLK